MTERLREQSHHNGSIENTFFHQPTDVGGDIVRVGGRLMWVALELQPDRAVAPIGRVGIGVIAEPPHRHGDEAVIVGLLGSADTAHHCP